MNEELSTIFDVTQPFVRSGDAHFHGNKISITHTIAQPTTQQLKDRDASQPFRSRDVGNEEEEILSDLSGKSDVKLYDALVLETKGYLNDVHPDQTQDERENALKGIPTAHKTPIMRAVLAVDSEVIYDESEEEVLSFIWTEDQTYRVRTEIGDTGNFIAYFTVKEPSQAQIDEYTGSTKFIIEKAKKTGQKPVTRITVSLEPAVKLFNSLVQEAEGLSVGAVDFDINNVEHKAKLGAQIKRSVVDAVLKETRLQLGE